MESVIVALSVPEQEFGEQWQKHLLNLILWSSLKTKDIPCKLSLTIFKVNTKIFNIIILEKWLAPTSFRSKRKGYLPLISSSGTGCLVRYNTWGPSFESTRDTSFLCFWLHPADVSHGMYYPLPQCVGALNIPFRSPLAGSAFLRLLSELLRLRDITTGSGTSPRHSCSSQLIFYFNFPVFEGEWLHQWIYFYSLFKILN